MLAGELNMQGIDRNMKEPLLKLRARLSFAPVVILIEDGRARKIRGNISNGLLSEFTLVAAEKQIRSGLITVNKDGRGPFLSFSGPFDGIAKQRFRNVWFAQPERKMMKV